MTKRLFGPRAGEPQLAADEYRLLRDLVCERLGVWFGPESRASLERRLRERLTVRGLTSFSDYHQFLKYAPGAADEWEEAQELLTTHETYFFREDYQLRAFKNEILPSFAARNGSRRRLHVWSAGCSTGEEVYTIAMLILESGLFEGWDVRVYGSDLSKRCIAAARRGVYGAASFRATPDAAKQTWFATERRDRSVKIRLRENTPDSPEPVKDDDLLTVAPQVRSICHFGQMNLLDDERTFLVGRCDVIFCRNVLLYFDSASRRRVIDMFHDRLVSGGVLLLGHAESLLNVSTAFELLHLREDLVYRKPSAAR